ncbi:MAG: carbonic anhydrase family protein [Limnobacter sp.]|nr:carbonic anhydrase family protein [Limnobacter sp.]
MQIKNSTPSPRLKAAAPIAVALFLLISHYHLTSTAAEPEAKKESKSLEDNPEALEKIRQILQKGIPERMTVQVKNSSKENSESGGVIRVAAPADANSKPAAKTTEKTAEKVDPKLDPKLDPKVDSKKDAKPEVKAEAKTEKKAEPKLEAKEIVKEEVKGEVKADPPAAPKAPKPIYRKPAPKPVEVAKQVTAWGYSGLGGPENWASLDPANQACSKGKNQSPIHIETGEAIPLNLEPLQLNYGDLYGTIVNTGNSVQVDTSGSNTMKVRGRSYGLSQIQFKHPAEEVINHQTYPMSLQWVHKDFQGNTAIVSVLVEVGEANPAINSLWSRMPFLNKERNPVLSSGLNLNTLLPSNTGYYAYTGSWTVPPCSEGVLWVVLKTPITLSAEQIATFAKLYPMNARPIQPTNGRLIQTSQ